MQRDPRELRELARTGGLTLLPFTGSPSALVRAGHWEPPQSASGLPAQCNSRKGRK